jgi:hypothetical protein
MNRKEDRLLTPALSSFEEEREKRGAPRFRGFMCKIPFRRILTPAFPLRERGNGSPSFAPPHRSE